MKATKYVRISFVIWLLIMFGILFEVEGNDVVNTVILGSNHVRSEVNSGSYIATVTAIENLPNGEVNNYSATHNVKFSGPYMRWAFQLSRKVGLAGQEGKNFSGNFDVYIDKTKGICTYYDGEKYNIRSLNDNDIMADPKNHTPGILPQELGKPRYLQSDKLTHKFLRDEVINSRQCVVVESRLNEATKTTIAHQWIDTSAFIVLKEKIWLQDNASQKMMILEEDECQIVLCDTINNLYGPKVYKRYSYKYPDFSVGNSELQKQETVTFDNLIYNSPINENDLVMTIPTGAKVADFIAGGVVYIAE